MSLATELMASAQALGLRAVLRYGAQPRRSAGEAKTPLVRPRCAEPDCSFNTMADRAKYGADCPSCHGTGFSG